MGKIGCYFFRLLHAFGTYKKQPVLPTIGTKPERGAVNKQTNCHRGTLAKDLQVVSDSLRLVRYISGT